MKLCHNLLICFMAFVAVHACARAEERTDCEVQADYALYVAQERDKGTPMADLLGRQKGSAPEQVWARMTVTNIYGNQLVTAQRVKELYMVRCNP